jgi:precorrin-6B methylase 1
MYHVHFRILESSFTETSVYKIPNPSSDNMLTSIMGFMWQNVEKSLHSLQQIQKKTALAIVL